MADDDEKSPLLENVSGPALEVPEPRRRIRSLFESDQVLGRHGNCLSSGVGAISISDVSPELLAAETDHIVAIFVVAFDTKAGNVIEWCMPEDADLEGVEFKAMVSGSHRLDKDFVYFRKDAMFGLACFENMPVESAIERGARMKSVGILATSYTLLYRHMQFLETQVRFLLTYPEDMTAPHWPGDDRHMLNSPGKYGRLKAFYEDKKGVLVNNGSSHSLAGSSTPLSTPGSEILPALKITHPAGCFTQFIQFFGDQIFVLWKYALLGKRILFFSPPPIGVVCYRVYCACCLANHHIGSSLTNRELTPHFYVNVADIESLETELSYIACTTEKIFEMKSNLYDVYVDNQNVTTQSEVLKDLLKISDADRDKFNKLNTQRSAHQFSREELGEDTLDDEDVFTSFFTEQNNRLFQTLLDVSMSQDRTLTADHMRSMGLDPIGDRSFLMELVETYGVDVILMVDNPCCPR